MFAIYCLRPCYNRHIIKTILDFMTKPQLTNTSNWLALQAHYKEMKGQHMRGLFQSDADRFERFSLRQGQIFLDYAKNRINSKTLELLMALARDEGLNSAIKDMFGGLKINQTENRAALHVALRKPKGQSLSHDGKDIIPQVARVLDQMEEFCTKIDDGSWRGYTKKRIKHIINIGIGGSDLGAQMMIHALKPYWNVSLKPHFVANIDAADINETLLDIDPEQSIFIIASKSFTSKETMANASAAKRWFLNSCGDDHNAIKKHFVAVSCNQKAVTEFGIDPDNMFEFWEWVGGRYSLWSAVGLPIAVMVGMDNFRQILAGAHEMDQHFLDAPFEKNMPVIMALLGIWYRDFFNAPSYAILPYDHSLRKLPAYLQQSDMESNGKSVTQKGEVVNYATGPIIWGAAGVNGQHAFYQSIHQGTQLIPADFIVPVNSYYELETEYGSHHHLLLSNCLAQTEALMWGREKEKVLIDCEDNPDLVAHRSFSGNRPSNTLLIDKVTPHSLGSLIALYEHKIFTQGFIWGINSFDQWGVELGKKLSNDIEPELIDQPARREHDSSTQGLIQEIKSKQTSA